MSQNDGMFLGVVRQMVDPRSCEAQVRTGVSPDCQLT
jgi:hypothetical protein